MSFRNHLENFSIWLRTHGQKALPQHMLSRCIGKLMASEIPWLKNYLIRNCMRIYDIDLNEAQINDPAQFKSFNAFFTRSLKLDSRPIDTSEAAIISPADGMVSQIGQTEHGQLIQAKGMHYDVATLLGGPSDELEQLRDGKFATIYLAPHDYHRVHLPVAGTLRYMRHIPGKLFSVNTLTSQHIPNLFAQNERVVAVFDTEYGPIAVVLVGAMLVASIRMAWHGIVTPPRSKRIREWNYSHLPPKHFKIGQEIGQFLFGSTVIVLAPNSISWDNTILPGKTIRVGELMGRG